MLWNPIIQHLLEYVDPVKIPLIFPPSHKYSKQSFSVDVDTRVEVYPANKSQMGRNGYPRFTSKLISNYL